MKKFNSQQNKLLEFIEFHQPRFTKTKDGWQIFTVATQHVTKPTLQEALDFCYYVIEEKPILKYPTLSELIKSYKEDKCEKSEDGKGLYLYRLSEIGYKPHFICETELIIYTSKEWQERQDEKWNAIFWKNILINKPEKFIV